ncbi:MAG TPA: hypothetical protein VHG08_18000 [Longimicrobium sp.]|nr:hypothetical protein [Longimicrobium sp.]
MPVPRDVLAAKTALSARLLRPGATPPTPDPFAHRVADAVELASRNVHAVGVGRKRVAGEETPVMAVRLYVARKLPLSLVRPEDRLPEHVDGIPTDVIESPPAVAMAAPQCTVDRQQQQRPLIAGISTAHPTITAGTLACFCRSTMPGDDPASVYVLSNNHVYAAVNGGHPGDPLLQPGPRDGGTAADAIADLARFVPLALVHNVTGPVTGGPVNQVDAALGRLHQGVQFTNAVCTIGEVTGTDVAHEGMAVRKHGRTTGYTEGVVVDEHYDTAVFYDPSTVGLFTGQMRLEGPVFGLRGDSGSLVVRKDAPLAVGLYFSGAPDGSYGVASYIDEVFTSLQITLL